MQILFSLVSKAKRVKLLHRRNRPLKQIWLTRGEFFAQLLDRMWPRAVICSLTYKS